MDFDMDGSEFCRASSGSSISWAEDVSPYEEIFSFCKAGIVNCDDRQWKRSRVKLWQIYGTKLKQYVQQGTDHLKCQMRSTKNAFYGDGHFLMNQPLIQTGKYIFISLNSI